MVKQLISWILRKITKNQLKGKDSDCATPLQGLWSIIIACAAQESILKETYIMIDEFLDQNKLGWVTEK